MDLKDVINSITIKVVLRQSKRALKISHEVTKNIRGIANIGLKVLLTAKNDASWKLTPEISIQRSSKGFHICLSKQKSIYNNKSNIRK